ncbi:MAG TPA: pyridoxal-phosphate dependent enzyme [Streptosporangiaceae bacterium]
MRLPSPLEEVADERLARAGVRLFLKRDDLISAEMPGNKCRKLTYNLEAARRSGHRVLLTFGGAYSNHIRATAAAGRAFGFATIGVIRGEEHEPLNPSLSYAAGQGMRLAYLDRTTYRAKAEPGVIAALRDRFGAFYLIPEGGSNGLAVRGCAEIPAEIGAPFDVMCCPCGTGGTLAGIAAGLGPGQRALGFSVLKGGQFLTGTVAGLQAEAFGAGAGLGSGVGLGSGAGSGNWAIDDRFHFGGFARRRPELDGFIGDFRDRHGLTLDWVYVAKMMYGIYTRTAEGSFPPGTDIVAVITG